MIQENIDVVVKGDYVWNEDEQNFHQNKIDLFKHLLVKFIEKPIFKTTNQILVNVEYWEHDQIFIIIEVSALKQKILSELKTDLELNQKFNIKT